MAGRFLAPLAFIYGDVPFRKTGSSQAAVKAMIYTRMARNMAGNRSRERVRDLKLVFTAPK